jgi:uncharacterized protein YndB with AHSA1/START domain
MTVRDLSKDPKGLTLVITAEFDAPVERVWQVWEDPRLLERWWGPPTWPATFTQHEFWPGGHSRYHMTGPEGEHTPGWWTIVAIDAPRTFEFEDGFATDDGEPNPDMPSMVGLVALEVIDSGTRMSVTTRFASLEQMEQVLAMGMEEGMTGAMGQIDALVAT